MKIPPHIGTIQTWFLSFLTDLPRYNWCTIYCILVYNFNKLHICICIHECITIISTCISPPKLFHPSLPSLIIPKQPWLLCIFQRFIYFKIILHVLILVCFPAVGIIILTFTICTIHSVLLLSGIPLCGQNTTYLYINLFQLLQILLDVVLCGHMLIPFESRT